MSVPRDLLTLTEGRAPGICVYAGAGLLKTNAVHTLWPPIKMYDWEGGTASILPWIARRRESHESAWTEYSDELRAQAFDMLNDKVKPLVRIRPAPLIDVVHFDNTRVAAYDEFVLDLGNFEYSRYNSLALDSLQEFAGGTQTFSRGLGNENKTMNEVPRAWFGAQERARMALRKLRNYRDSGVLVYFIGAEDIAKDYVDNPIEKRAPGSSPPEPYSVKGTVALPGQLAEALAHLPDILCHARLMNGKVTWVTEPEPLPGGSAHWDAKDRFGRLDKYETANIRAMTVKLYGEEIAKRIYGLTSLTNRA